MYVLYIKWNGLKCEFRTNSPDAVHNLQTMSPSLLGRGNFTLQLDPPLTGEASCFYKLLYLNSTDEKQLSIKNTNEIVLVSPWEDVRDTEQFKCLLLLVFEHANCLRNRFICHGSAVSFANQVYIFSGPNESGKTTVAVELCLRYGAKLVANDHAELLMQEEVAYVAPTQRANIYFRSNALSLANPQLYSKLYHMASDRSTPYVRKKSTAKALGITEESRILPLSRIYYIGLGLTPNVEEYTPSPLDSRLSIYSDISSTLRSTSLLLFNNQGNFDLPLPILMDRTVEKMLMSFIDTLIANNQIWKLRGPLEQILEKVVGNASKQ